MSNRPWYKCLNATVTATNLLCKISHVFLNQTKTTMSWPDKLAADRCIYYVEGEKKKEYLALYLLCDWLMGVVSTSSCIRNGDNTVGVEKPDSPRGGHPKYTRQARTSLQNWKYLTIGTANNPNYSITPSTKGNNSIWVLTKGGLYFPERRRG